MHDNEHFFLHSFTCDTSGSCKRPNRIKIDEGNSVMNYVMCRDEPKWFKFELFPLDSKFVSLDNN